MNTVEKQTNHRKKLHRKLTCLLLIFIVLPLSAFSWNKIGHQLVAAIAWQHLDHETRIQLKPYVHDERQFLKYSTWMDDIKSKDNEYNSLHYINRPIYTSKPRFKPPVKTPNIITAISDARVTWNNPKADYGEKLLALKFMIHLYGDIAQPLHCASRYSWRDFDHDQGGNTFLIKSRDAANLHQFWDRGLGLFYKHFKTSSPSMKKINEFARQIEKRFPEKDFAGQVKITNPKIIADESYQIAKEKVYQTPEFKKPSKEYVRDGQEIVKRQIVLAGYRLAYALNSMRES